MRKQDKHKTPDQKAIQTINFDKIVLQAAEEKARKLGTSVSNLVNMAVRRFIMNEVRFNNEMALYHAEQLAKYEFLRNRAANLEMEKEEIVTHQLRQ